MVTVSGGFQRHACAQTALILAGSVVWPCCFCKELNNSSATFRLLPCLFECCLIIVLLYIIIRSFSSLWLFLGEWLLFQFVLWCYNYFQLGLILSVNSRYQLKLLRCLNFMLLLLFFSLSCVCKYIFTLTVVKKSSYCPTIAIGLYLSAGKYWL